jgi:citrate lyase subunit beta/citryl-CoA lyase
MRLRSLLFVPADNDKKLQKTAGSAADALIFDLEDSVAPPRKAIARKMCAAHLQATWKKRSWKAFVRVNPFSAPEYLDDLAAVIVPGVDGVVLPKVEGLAQLELICAQIDALEARAGMERGSTRVLVVSTETARAMSLLHTYVKKVPRLAGLTWGAEDLSTDIGASTNRELDGEYSHVYLMARSMCLMAARASETAAIDTLFSNFRDPAALEADCIQSRRRGFVGRIAIHPDQVDVINRCYAPSAEDLAHARLVVAAFDANPDLGTVGIEGRMYDRPHLLQARQTLANADDSGA